MFHVAQAICGTISHASGHTHIAYELTGDQRVPNWLLASSFGWRSCKALIVSERLPGQADVYWNRSGGGMCDVMKINNLEARYPEARKKLVGFENIKVR